MQIEFASATDPLIALIEHYQEMLAAYREASRGGIPESELDAFADETFYPALDMLKEDPPTPTSYAGALAGIEFVIGEMRNAKDSDWPAILDRCLAYLRNAL